MSGNKNYWKTVSFVLAIILIIIIGLIIIWPERIENPCAESRIGYVMRGLSTLKVMQDTIKENRWIDKNNNGKGEYADIETMEALTKFALEYLKTDAHYAHYNYVIRVGESIEEREKSFEIYAVPKICWPCDEAGDGIMAFAIDETGIIKWNYCNYGDVNGKTPPIGTMKQWTTYR